MGRGGGFSCEPLSLREGFAVLQFSGKNAHEAFKREAGGHRIQQVSPTERKGRVHSSTVTVAVLKEATSAEIKLSPKDLRVETYRSSGPGGQNVNKVETAVRITHIPTGVQACSEIKSQARNKTLALAALKARLVERQRQIEQAERNQKRKQQLGTGARSCKVRTIAHQRGRVECHVSGKKMQLKRYLQGYIDELWR